jgi:UDP-glucose 4-epimerase
MLEAVALLENISGRTLDVRHVDRARGDVSRTRADVSRIHDALSWEPRVPLADGLARMWAWASARVAAQ